MESELSKVKVNNEIALCKTTDKDTKAIIEKALLKERISYFIKWDKPGFFSGNKLEGYTFCVNEWQAEAAENVIASLGDEVESKIKYIMKKTDKTLF